ncbi:hypothetical protein As57867_007452, partial [Aphanomyces stellatus]
MKLSALFFAISTTSATIAPSVHYLTDDARASLAAELKQWKAKFGSIAKAQGLLPPASNAHSLADTVTDELQRLLNNKHAVEVARKNNPKATFSTDHKFALMTEVEFATYVKGSFQEGSRSLRSLPETKHAPTGPQAAAVDWTTGSCMPPVRDQGQCGSCWAFSATGAAEMGHCVATGQLLDLSAQQVTSCSTEGGSAGCMGGWPWYAIDYAAKTGLCLESDWPYTSGQSGDTGSCTNNCARKK